MIDDVDVLIQMENYHHPLRYQYEGHFGNHRMDYRQRPLKRYEYFKIRFFFLPEIR
jgi:hypothetical protein